VLARCILFSGKAGKGKSTNSAKKKSDQLANQVKEVGSKNRPSKTPKTNWRQIQQIKWEGLRV
jgi:hypothetical protein